MRHGSLFSGIGGFDLAAEWMGWENIFHCEWNRFGQKVLNYYWPNAKAYNDIKQSDFTLYKGSIDVLTGGFPCQGFSLAGQRLGTDDDRYLWPEMLRVIKEVRPTWIIGENVVGIQSMEDKSGVWSEVFARVEDRKIIRYDTIDLYEAIFTQQAKMLITSICEDLEKEGYQVQPIVIPAASVNAPHRRERVWFVAYSESNSRNNGRGDRSISSPLPQKRFDESIITPHSNGQSRKQENDKRPKSGQAWEPLREEFPTQSPVCDGDDGLSSRLDGITFSDWRVESLKGGGNAIVPQVAYEIFKAIESVLVKEDKR